MKMEMKFTRLATLLYLPLMIGLVMLDGGYGNETQWRVAGLVLVLIVIGALHSMLMDQEGAAELYREKYEKKP